MHINTYKCTLTHARKTHTRSPHFLLTKPVMVDSLWGTGEETNRPSNHTSWWCSVIRSVQAHPRVSRMLHPWSKKKRRFFFYRTFNMRTLVTNSIHQDDFDMKEKMFELSMCTGHSGCN